MTIGPSPVAPAAAAPAALLPSAPDVCARHTKVPAEGSSTWWSIGISRPPLTVITQRDSSRWPATISPSARTAMSPVAPEMQKDAPSTRVTGAAATR
jgi:hypothetical protein